MDYEKIQHLMTLYGWCTQEAFEYLAYEPYDPIDWVDTQWEKTE